MKRNNVGYILNIVRTFLISNRRYFLYTYVCMHVSRAKPFYFKPDKGLAVNEMQIEIKQEKI